MRRAASMVALFYFSTMREAVPAMHCLLRKKARIATGLLCLYFPLVSGTARLFLLVRTLRGLKVS